MRSNSVLINGMAPGNRSSRPPRRGLLQTVFNRGTQSIQSGSLQIPGNRGNHIMSIQIFAHRRNSRLPPNTGVIIQICITRGHGVRINSGVTNHRNGGKVVSHVLPVRSVPCLPSNAPVSVTLGPLNIPSQVGINRIFRYLLN